MQGLKELDWIALTWLGSVPYLVVYLVMMLKTGSCLLPLRPFKMYKMDKENETGAELLVVFLYSLLAIWTAVCVTVYALWK